ncbi:hypothetical protein M409DRAFT_60294 [Zasmidium cellare ATCC 36951]|uniref:Uncharacterized protein n=1 Tax=Zasmidium cellare ATCC 36951 TaxID=1080233 RepID=A0A6A6BZ13_ZASCE|nr:uncharacterized protein M409DRAFT_60294 [Zasmidium cellare ATCC 36951]KAF2160031.1 hypothetical protein M409DRAFT_60294 [Zasmidium cellare ATCC 36951]
MARPMHEERSFKLIANSLWGGGPSVKLLHVSWTDIFSNSHATTSNFPRSIQSPHLCFHIDIHASQPSPTIHRLDKRHRLLPIMSHIPYPYFDPNAGFYVPYFIGYNAELPAMRPSQYSFTFPDWGRPSLPAALANFKGGEEGQSSDEVKNPPVKTQPSSPTQVTSTSPAHQSLSIPIPGQRLFSQINPSRSRRRGREGSPRYRETSQRPKQSSSPSNGNQSSAPPISPCSTRSNAPSAPTLAFSTCGPASASCALRVI